MIVSGADTLLHAYRHCGQKQFQEPDLCRLWLAPTWFKSFKEIIQMDVYIRNYYGDSQVFKCCCHHQRVQSSRQHNVYHKIVITLCSSRDYFGVSMLTLCTSPDM